MEAIHSEWQINQKGHLFCSYKFKNFAQALAFAIKVGDCAESMNHHPRIVVEWGHCSIELWTHEANDVTDKDRALAKLIDQIQ
ncbi:MAG: 4a-hydroxytetrahydrobiopterin dehydratase [Pseudomonadota bacterium]